MIFIKMHNIRVEPLRIIDVNQKPEIEITIKKPDNSVTINILQVDIPDQLFLNFFIHETLYYVHFYCETLDF